MIVRPGSPTANAIILRDAMKAGTDPVDLPRIWRCRITHEHLTTAGTSQALDLRALFAATHPIPDEIKVGLYDVTLEEVFAGGSISAMTIIFGESSPVNDTDGYLTSTDVFTGATLGVKEVPSAALFGMRYRATSTPILTFTSTTDNVDAATSGVLDVCLRYTLMPSRRAA